MEKERNYKEIPYRNSLADQLSTDQMEYDEMMWREVGPVFGSAFVGGCLGGLISGSIGGILGYFSGEKINNYFDIGNEIGRGAIEVSSSIGGATLGFFSGVWLGAYTLGSLLLLNYGRLEEKRVKEQNEK